MPGRGTDFDAIRRHHVSVTPILIDLTRYTALDKVASWLKGASAISMPSDRAQGGSQS